MKTRYFFNQDYTLRKFFLNQKPVLIDNTPVLKNQLFGNWQKYADNHTKNKIVSLRPKT